MKVAFNTLGCKVNSYETEAMIEQFQQRGFEIVDFDEYSDIYVINSCMVTNTGERKSKKIIKRPIKINSDAIVIVMGCLTQLKADEILGIDGVKIVIGTKNRDKMFEYLDEYLQSTEKQNGVQKLQNNEEFDNLFISDFQKHQRAFLKIQDGCNNFCSYCIIPYTRGRVRSKKPEIVLQEARKLVASGHIEIVLTGIHTGGYGMDLVEYDFADLLNDLEAIEGLKRIRISSIEITELTDKVIQIINRSKKIVNHIHIPLQGGTNRILKAMNRKYTTQDYLQFINTLRENIPNLAITTDIIVGFPGETDEDFEETIAFIKQVGFMELHVFPFSRREGTRAANMHGQIDGEIKKERVRELLKLSEELKTRHINNQLGKYHRIIPEQMKDGYMQGHTRDYILVRLPVDETLIGKEVEACLQSYDGTYCYTSDIIQS